MCVEERADAEAAMEFWNAFALPPHGMVPGRVLDAKNQQRAMRLASASKCLAQDNKSAGRARVYGPPARLRGHRMSISEKVECPSCHALFKVVRVSSGQAGLRVFDCKVCKRPLVSEQNGKIIGYFLIRRPPSAS
jgi:hypothetical protein